jgi:large subunit ribosomal protein L14e
MPAIEVGRICVKLMGREAGRKCVIVDLIDKNFVLLTGPKKITGVKRRRTNTGHIEPTQGRINIDKGSTDEDVIKALEAADKIKYMQEILKPKV